MFKNLFDIRRQTAAKQVPMHCAKRYAAQRGVDSGGFRV